MTVDLRARVDQDWIDKFWSRVDMNPHHCWEWQGYVARNGYGYVGVGTTGRGGKTFLTHRVAYVLSQGDIPDGLHIDHLCRNRKCCNPDHLEPVTSGENTRRSPLVGKWERTHCRQGHELTPETTGIRKSGRDVGKRWCKLCAKERA